MLDEAYGSSWHVVVGEGFGFDVSYEVAWALLSGLVPQVRNLLYMFHAGSLAVCVWRCS